MSVPPRPQQSLFRDDPPDSASVTDSSVTFSATSSTIPPGIGSISGRFIQGVGKGMLRGVEIMVIRARLAHIKSLYPLSDNTPPKDVDRIYDELLELVRFVVWHYIYAEVES
jgi:hypothetical protein